MRRPLSPTAALLAITVLSLILFNSLLSTAAATTVWVTPHESYSSSVGVLGCKIDTDRVAYWPAPIDCDNICVSLSRAGRTLYLLRIDQSAGAHDVSYDAWNYLVTGSSATKAPTAGGAVEMDTRDVPADKCRPLLGGAGGRFPLSAANSMNFLASCLDGRPESFVARNYRLYNIMDPICTWGHDEECELDWPGKNQAACPRGLGDPAALTSAPVWNVQYPTGQRVKAGSPPVAPGAAGPPGNGAAGRLWGGGLQTGGMSAVVLVVVVAVSTLLQQLF